jgi:glutamate--cysteine ligase regulatory subunit
MTGGPSIIRKPGAERSNLELTNSLRSNFLVAQEDYSPPESTSNGTLQYTDYSDEEDVPSRRAQVSAWTHREASDWYIPRIDWSMSGLSEEASQYEITVKLFFLPGSDSIERPRYVRDAIQVVLRALRVEAIDLLIVSFPGLSFEGDCEWEADRMNSAQGDIREEIETWPAIEKLYSEGVVRKLGLAEFGSEKLTEFLKRVSIRPEVDQINVRDCCNVPPPLVKLAKAENITLLTHSDCTNVLPSGTLRELLGQGPRGAGVVAEAKRGVDGVTKGDLSPLWVVKYTAVVRNRGVIEHKGYFASAEHRE